MDIYQSVFDQFSRFITSSAVRIVDPETGDVVQEQGAAAVFGYFPNSTPQQASDNLHRCLVMGKPLLNLINTGEQDGTDAIFFHSSGLNKEAKLICELNRLRDQTITDDLTGLYNRRYIDECLPSDIQDCVKQRRPLSILFVDLDYYKKINDVYGHAAGDAVLSELSGILLTHTRQEKDWVARYGGEEFLILLNDCENEKAKNIAEEIRVAVMNHVFQYNGLKIHVTCSFGVITIDDFSVSHPIDKVLDTVDKRLYQAKQLGRNIVI
jgi:two-component system, cell cycle response regulator